MTVNESGGRPFPVRPPLAPVERRRRL